MDKIMPEPSNNLLADFDRWMESGEFPERSWFTERGFSRFAMFDATDSLSFKNYMSHWQTREWFISKYGFSIPCKEAIEAVAKLSPLVEIGAGSAYWTRALQAAGADIVATDKDVDTLYGFKIGRHAETLRLGATQAVKKFPERNVFLSWPCHNKEWATRAITAMRPGQKLALIGEFGGCTGSPSLFKTLDRDFREVDSVAIPQFQGISDHLDLYERV